MTTNTTYRDLNTLLERAARPSTQPVEVTDDQLLALQARWITALSARLDEAIESSQPDDGIPAVLSAWRRLAADLPILRLLLDDREPGSRALARARDTEFRMLALAAGLAGLDDPRGEAVRAGRALLGLTGRDGSGRPADLAHAG